MFDDFDYSDESIERLFSYLEKDKFCSLSLHDQKVAIDILVELTRGKHISDDGTQTATLEILSKSDRVGNIDDIIDEIGIEKFKEILRKTVLSGDFSYMKFDMDECKDLLEKASEGTLTEEEESQLKSLLSLIGRSKTDKENIEFSTFAILKMVSNSYMLNEKIDDNDEIELIADSLPVVQAAYTVQLASLLSTDNNQIGKMFRKFGLSKTMFAIDEQCYEITDTVIKYAKEHDFAPEVTALALLNMVRIILSSGHIQTSLKEYDMEKIEDAFGELFVAISGIDNSDVKEFEKNFSTFMANPVTEDKVIFKDSDKKSPNGDKKEKEEKEVDIMKLLLDD